MKYFVRNKINYCVIFLSTFLSTYLIDLIFSYFRFVPAAKKYVVIFQHTQDYFVFKFIVQS